MAATDIDIANLAIRHLGISTMISSFEDPRSKASVACGQYYEQCRDEVLRDFTWDFATRFQTLTLVTEYEEDDDHPTAEWRYSYRVPSDCLRIRRILNGASRIEDQDSRVKWREISDDDGLLVLTDQADAVMEYTTNSVEVGRFPPDFVQTVALLLATYLAPSLSDPGKLQLADRCARLYMWRRGEARANAANERSPDRPPDSEMISGR